MTIIGLTEAQALLADQTRSVIVLDVRKPDEYNEGHLEGANLVDVTDDGFTDKISELDSSAEYLVYCKLGGRSARAVEQMTSMGFTSLHDLEGGFTAWADAELPIDTTQLGA